MRITGLSKNCTLKLYIDTLDDLSLLIKTLTPVVTTFLENGFETTTFCLKCKNADWKIGEPFVVFNHSSAKIDEE